MSDRPTPATHTAQQILEAPVGFPYSPGAEEIGWAECVVEGAAGGRIWPAGPWLLGEIRAGIKAGVLSRNDWLALSDEQLAELDAEPETPEPKTVKVAVEDINGSSVTYTVGADTDGNPEVFQVGSNGVLAIGFVFYAPGTWRRAYSLGLVVAEAPEA